VVNIGIAAHITAAAAGGPRYDATLSSEQRRDHSNGIWLCQTHGKLVDSDEVHFTVAMLREWKTQAEQSSFRAILSRQGAPANSALPLSAIDQLVERIRAAAVADLAGFRRAPGWPSHPIALSLRLTSGDEPLVVPDALFTVERSAPHGHIEAVLQMIRRLELDTVIASKRSRERDLGCSPSSSSG